tara:strand:+ start:470 stop:580 length:111 start_codon:yes stop_codon:yes gene_type:complete
MREERIYEKGGKYMMREGRIYEKDGKFPKIDEIKKK